MMHFTWRALTEWGWLFLLLITTAFLWRTRQFLRAAQRWPVAPGQIVDFEWSGEGRLPWPKIGYTYYIEGKEYRGDQFFLLEARRSHHDKHARQVAYKAALAYKNRELIDVYYNPGNPEQAVLDVTKPGRLDILLGLLFGLIVFQIAWMVF